MAKVENWQCCLKRKPKGALMDSDWSRTLLFQPSVSYLHFAYNPLSLKGIIHIKH